MDEIIIRYKDGEGKITDRRISEIVPYGVGAIDAFCHLRQEIRTFNVKQIVHATNPESGEVVNDIYKCFGLPTPKEVQTNTINPSLLSKAPGHSSEAYKGQRKSEKHELFKRFRYSVIADLYKERLFSAFGHRCYKCGHMGELEIDHHIAMVLGGHLVPGNLVALCKRCNNKKRDVPPEVFYSSKELIKLQPILEKQNEVFDFEFDWDRWNTDRKEYLLFLGVAPDLVNEVLTDPENRYFIGDESPNTQV